MKRPFGSMDSKAFAEARFSRSWIVDGLLVRKQVGVIGGEKKCMKTSMIVDMSVSIATGTPVLDRFQVPRARKVAVFSGETDPGTLRETAFRVCKSKRVKLSECSVHWSFELPRLSDSNQLQVLGTFLAAEKIEVVFIDPLYLCLLGGSKGVSASNLFEMGPLLHAAARACLAAGATPIFAHHATKTSAKRREASEGLIDLNDLAFSGIPEFVRQWILLSRRTPFVPGSGRHELQLSAGGSAGHSGLWNLTINEGRLKPDFTGRVWDVVVDDVDTELLEDSTRKLGPNPMTENLKSTGQTRPAAGKRSSA